MRTSLTEAAGALRDLLRRRPNLAIFAVGVALFAGGLAGVISRQLSVEGAFEELRENLSPAARGNAGVTGPPAQEPLAPYIQNRRAFLARKASQEPRGRGVGVVVFGSYRTPSQVEGFARTRGLRPEAVHLRVPIETFGPEEIAVGRTGVRGAVKELEAQIRGELEVLEGVLSDVTDPAFKAVYAKDAERKRQALRLLDGDPAVIFAVVLRETYSALARAEEAPHVRYVDVVEDGGAATRPPAFSAPLPEEEERRGSP